MLLLSSCTLAKVKIEVLSERTALENQVLGTYNALDKEMLLAASVRGVDSSGKTKKAPAHSFQHKNAVEAIQLINFFDDDILLFKQIGWAGENRLGLLTSFKRETSITDPTLKDIANRFSEDEFVSIITKVNDARKIIMHRVIDLGENLSDKDLPAIQNIFGKLNISNALPYEKIQTNDGSWAVKSSLQL